MHTVSIIIGISIIVIMVIFIIKLISIGIGESEDKIHPFGFFIYLIIVLNCSFFVFDRFCCDAHFYEDYCGVIIEKYSELDGHRRKRTYYYFRIKYKGVVFEESVNRFDYHSKSIGDIYCSDESFTIKGQTSFEVWVKKYFSS